MIIQGYTRTRILHISSIASLKKRVVRVQDSEHREKRCPASRLVPLLLGLIELEPVR
jgi:hypothetical protein